MVRDRTTANEWKNRARMLALFIALVLFLGLINDLFSGLPLTRGSRSWGIWLLGIFGFGTLYLLGEAAADWINGRDNVTDPPAKRALNLVLLLTLVLVVCAAAVSIIWMAQ